MDRHLEGGVRSIRVDRGGVQLFQLDSEHVYEWYEVSLTPSDERSVWRRIADARIDGMERLYMPPPPPPGEPPVIHEEDALVVRQVLDGAERFVRVDDRISGPPALSELWEYLERLARGDGRRRTDVAEALYGEPLDVPNFPATISLAQVLANGGVSFETPSAPWLEAHPSLRSAVARPGWLTPIDEKGLPNELKLPVYVVWRDRHCHLRGLRVSLLDE